MPDNSGGRLPLSANDKALETRIYDQSVLSTAQETSNILCDPIQPDGHGDRTLSWVWGLKYTGTCLPGGKDPQWVRKLPYNERLRSWS